MTTKTITTSRAYKTFADGSKTRRFRVDGDTVRAFDRIAGHYTIHHGLTKRQEAMISASARKA